MSRSNKNRNRCLECDLNLKYKRFKFRENRKGVINHIRRSNRINNLVNDDLN